MRELMEAIREQLNSDAVMARGATHCNRRGTAARLCRIVDNALVTLTGMMRVNGGPHCSSEEANCGCPHAEQKLLTETLPACSGLILLTTLEPCVHCANLIVLSRRIKRVAWLQPYRDQLGRRILNANDVRCFDADGPFTFSCSVQ